MLVVKRKSVCYSSSLSAEPLAGRACEGGGRNASLVRELLHRYSAVYLKDPKNNKSQLRKSRDP